jgi:hypothetical protein
MSSTTETGHAKNLSNFQQLIANCESLGANFNPARKELTITALMDTARNADAALEQLTNAKTRYNNATNHREVLFGLLPKLSTRLFNSLAAFGVSELTLDDARTINRKVQGAKAPATIAANEQKKLAAPADSNAPIGISTAQLSFDSLIQHFTRWYALLRDQPVYMPHEKELSTAHIGMLIEQLQEANRQAIEAEIESTKARIHRDKILYENGTGLTHIAADVKNYIKAIFGSQSPEYKSINHLHFKTRTK